MLYSFLLITINVGCSSAFRPRYPTIYYRTFHVPEEKRKQSRHKSVYILRLSDTGAIDIEFLSNSTREKEKIYYIFLNKLISCLSLKYNYDRITQYFGALCPGYLKNLALKVLM